MTAIQTPFLAKPAEQLAPRRFRKAILPHGAAEHPQHGRVPFDLEALRRNFSQGAMTMVPFMLGLTAAPDRMAGEVVELAVDDEGLSAVLELSEGGELVLGAVPDLPVSVLVKQQHGGQVLARVCADFDGEIDLADAGEVLDFSNAGWTSQDRSDDAKRRAFAETFAYEQGFTRTPPSKEAIELTAPQLTSAERERQEFAEAWLRQHG